MKHEITESETVTKFKGILDISVYAEIVKIVDGSEPEEQDEKLKPIKDRQWKIYLKDFTRKGNNVSVVGEHAFCWWIASFDKLSEAWGDDSTKWHGKRIEVTLYQNGKYVNERGVCPA